MTTTEDPQDQALVAIPQFRLLEPAFKNEQAIYQAAREVPGFPVVRIGRRIYIDMNRWRLFKKNGGAALPGGWRRQPRDAT
jgi:hypothetical protein